METKSLTEKFDLMIENHTDDQEALKNIFNMIDQAPESGERDGLLALIYHEGIGVDPDLDKSFEFAEKAAFEKGDPLGYYILGYMCDNIETPDQAHGGPRQKYDHYDAERFYEICSRKESKWKIPACHWLGDYYMNSARGGDTEIGVEYYEKIANEDADAAAKLSDYYWDMVIPYGNEDEYWTLPLFKWTKVAAQMDPEGYANQLGWLYADGIGCKQSFWLALKYFSEAYFNDDWRGAYSIANILEDYLERHSELPDDEKDALKDFISSWSNKAEEMKEKSYSEENDCAEEED